MWVDNPKVQLVLEDILNKIDPILAKSIIYQIKQ